MWKLTVLLSLLAVVQGCRVIVERANGVQQPRSAHVSHVLLETFLTYEQKYLCSGVLISANHVLTTVNCVFGWVFVNVHVYPYKLRDVFEDAREIHRSTEVHYKPEFNLLDHSNDVALVKLPVTLNVAARPYAIAQLPAASSMLMPGHEGKSVGWGLLNYKDDNAAAFKHEQTMKVISDDICREAYPGWWANESARQGRICILRNFGANCVSDTGSPFYIGDVVYGLQSFGQREACDSAYPNGIQEVRVHLDWINSILAA